MTPKIRATEFVLAWLLVFDYAPTLAATNDDQHEEARHPDEQIEEIVIEGERSDSISVMETSYSVAVFTDAELRRGTDREMNDLLRRVPNVIVDPFNGAPVIRGVAERGINTGIAGAVVNTVKFADGVLTPSTQNLWDTDQVAVSRGPESFMSGGFIGGTTNVDSNDPTDSPDGNVTTSWAPDSDDRRIGIAYGGRATDTLGYRFAGYLRSSDGFLENATRDDSNWTARDERLLRTKLQWRPAANDDTVVKLRAEYLQGQSNGTPVIAGGPDIDPFDREAIDDLPTHDKSTTTSTNLEVEHAWDERWSTHLVLAYARLLLRGSGDSGSTAANEGTYRYHADQDSFAASIRVFYETGPWQAFFRQYGVRLDESNSSYDALVPFDFDGDGDLPGIDGNLRYMNPTADWWFVGTQAGLRREFDMLALSASLTRSGQTFDRGRRSVSWSRHGSTGDADLDAAFDSIFATFFPQADVTKGLDDFNYLPRYIAEYTLTTDVSVGVKFERAARLGGVWFNAARGTTNTYDDEFADSYDAFLRSSWLDGRLTLRMNAFDTRLTDQQVLSRLSDVPNDEELINVPRSHNNGLEVESALATGAWRFWCSAGLLHTEFDEVEFNGEDHSGDDYDTPDWTVSFGIVYSPSLGPFAELDVTARPEGGSSEQRTLLNARLGWALPHAEISLFARNLLDEEYFDFHDPDSGSGGANQRFIVGEPREVGITVSVLR